MGALLRSSVATWSHFEAAAADLDLAATQARSLLVLGEAGRMPMRALAETLVCDPSTVTALVDRLEARGLLQRAPDPGDRRVKTLTLTAAGQRLRQRLLTAALAPMPELSRLTTDETRRLVDLLEKLDAEA